MDRNRKLLPRLFSIALALFVTFLALDLRMTEVRDTQEVEPFSGESGRFLQYAVNLEKFGIFSGQSKPDGAAFDWQPPADAIHPPGYPSILWVFLREQGQRLELSSLLGFQALLGALIALLTYLIFQNVLGMVPAVIAGVLVALSPMAMNLGGMVVSETVYAFLLMLAVWLMSMTGRRVELWFLVGMVLGLCALVDASALFLVVLLALALISAGSAPRAGTDHMNRIFHTQPHRRALVMAVVMLLGFFLLMGPWMARNGTVLGVGLDLQLAKEQAMQGLLNPPGSAQASYWSALIGQFQLSPWQSLSWHLFEKPWSFWSWGLSDHQIFLRPVSTSPFLFGGPLEPLVQISRYLHVPVTALGLLLAVLIWIPAVARGIAIWMGDRAVWVVKMGSALVLGSMFIHMVGLPLPRYAMALQPLITGFALLPLGLLLGRSKMLERDAVLD